MKKIFMALMAVASIAMTSCDPEEEPKDPNEGNQEQTDPQPQPQAADVTIAIGVTPDWLTIADFAIYDSVGTAPAKAEELTDIYTNLVGGLSFVRLSTSDFEGSTLVFRGFMQTKKFQPNDMIDFRCELTLKDNYMEILQGMEEGSEIVLAAMHACATQSNAPEYLTHITSGSGGLDVAGLLQYLEKYPKHLEEMVDRFNKSMSGTYAYDGFLAGVM